MPPWRCSSWWRRRGKYSARARVTRWRSRRGPRATPCGKRDASGRAEEGRAGIADESHPAGGCPAQGQGLARLGADRFSLGGQDAGRRVPPSGPDRAGRRCGFGEVRAGTEHRAPDGPRRIQRGLLFGRDGCRPAHGTRAGDRGPCPGGRHAERRPHRPGPSGCRRGGAPHSRSAALGVCADRPEPGRGARRRVAA